MNNKPWSHEPNSPLHPQIPPTHKEEQIIISMLLKITTIIQSNINHHSIQITTNTTTPWSPNTQSQSQSQSRQFHYHPQSTTIPRITTPWPPPHISSTHQSPKNETTTQHHQPHDHQWHWNQAKPPTPTTQHQINKPFDPNNHKSKSQRPPEPQTNPIQPKHTTSLPQLPRMTEHNTKTDHHPIPIVTKYNATLI